MKLRNWLAPALVLSLVLLLVVSFNEAQGAYRVYVPVGYIEEVQRLIDEDKLVFDCQRDEIQPQSLSPAEDYFYRNSYLKGDVDSWNQDGDHRPFLVEREDKARGECEGSLVAPNPNHHKQRLPTFFANRWRGSLYLRPGRAATTLTSSDRTVEVVGAPWRILPLAAKAFEDTYFGGDQAGVRSHKLAFKIPRRGISFATLKNIGDRAALEVTAARPTLALNGCKVDVGWRVRLDGGDRVRIEEPGVLDEHYLAETGRRAGLVSFVSEVNGALRRRTFTDRLSMAQDVAYAIDSAVVAGLERAAEGEKSAVRDDFDVHLTLDPFLDQRLQHELAKFARGRYERRPLRAAVTVMEAQSGRLLALASYPTPDDLDDLQLKSPGHRDLLRQNHNFLQHPVGSAAKPFLAAAAISLQPRLAQLEVRCFPDGAEPPTSLLGYPLGKYNLPGDCQANPNSNRVDFDGFLTVSSNRYMLYLGLLALAEWEGGAPQSDRAGEALPPEEAYYLGGRSFSRRPFLPAYRNVRGGDTQLAELGEQPFIRRYRDLFGQETHYRRGTLVEALDLEIWNPVLQAAGLEARDRSVLGFGAVTPEKVNLRANQMQWLRQDLYTTLLGNGNNRWSNIHLAEALARLMTGQTVKAKLVEQVISFGEEEGEEEILFDATALAPTTPLDLSDQHRKLVIQAMGKVVTANNGTAYKGLNPTLSKINRAAPQGVEYLAFGKTGTPTLTPAAIRRSPSRIGPGAQKRYGQSEQVQSSVLVLGVERRVGGSSEGLVISAYIEAQGGSSEAVDLVAQMLEPLVEAMWPEDWLVAGGR